MPAVEQPSTGGTSSGARITRDHTRPRFALLDRPDQTCHTLTNHHRKHGAADVGHGPLPSLACLPRPHGHATPETRPAT
eukprot:11073121-Lingulodinium_polyedra.AAC.1